MKKILYICLSLLFALSVTSCGEWLDINDSPNNPNSTTASVPGRLAWIQHHYMYAQMTAGARAGFITGMNTQVSTGTRDGSASGWNPSTALSTTPYQFFFVASAANLGDLDKKAATLEATHYLAASKVVRAMGFMMLTDWYGEMPFTEALSEVVTPKYDDGKTIFEGCVKLVDEALELFAKPQGENAPDLKEGDLWNEGDVQKWVALCYGLKARWMNNLSKKSIYNPDEVLSFVAKGPQSNAQSTVIEHQDVANDRDVLFSDPLHTSYIFDSVGMNTNSRPTKWYADILVNFDGKGTIDPRADRLIPLAQFGAKKEWIRSAAVDMNSDIRVEKGPMGVSYNAADTILPIQDDKIKIKPHSWYVNTDNAKRQGDTIYVTLKSSSIGYNADTDDQYKAKDGRILSTSSFYVRPTGPTHVMCYHEMCFIKAEILFNKGDKAGAFNAYKEGIKAHMDLMNINLNTYASENPSKTPMTSTEISNYLDKAIGTSADITLEKIMQQKYVALSFQQQNWNDMRRYDYGGAAYASWKVPYEYSQNSSAQAKIPAGNMWRRIMHCSHEINYNSENLKASNPKALAEDVWTVPVWWDTKD